MNRLFSLDAGCADSHQYDQFLRFSGLQIDIHLKCSAAVVACGQRVLTFSFFHDNRVCIRAVGAEKNFAVRIESFYFRSCDCQERMPSLPAVFEMFRTGGHENVRSVIDDRIDNIHLHNKLCILKIYHVLSNVPVVCVFDIRKSAQCPLFFTGVFKRYQPALVIFSERNEVECFRFDAGIFRGNFCVGRTVTAFGFKILQRLADRLPACGPEVFALLVVEIQIPAGLIHGNNIETKPREPALCCRLVETVAAGIVGDDRAVFRRSQIIAPGSWSVRPFDDVFFVRVVKISESHSFSFLRLLFFFVNAHCTA